MSGSTETSANDANSVLVVAFDILREIFLNELVGVHDGDLTVLCDPIRPPVGFGTPVTPVLITAFAPVIGVAPLVDAPTGTNL